MLLRRVALLVILLASPGFAPGPDDPDEEKFRGAESLELATRESRSWTFRPSNGGAPFVLRPEPVQKWTQPVYGTVYGHVYVWTAQGQPQVIASLLKWYQPFTHLSDEFHSLATQGIVGELDGKPSWFVTEPGVEYKPIPGAPEPGKTRAARLRQVRDLAKDFAGRETDRKQEDRDLRLLPQPVYRYETPEGDAVDGALFLLAHGTDPDAVLVIESRPVDGPGPARWHFALVRMTTSALRVMHKGQEIWSVPLISYDKVYSHREPYTTFRFDGARATPPLRVTQP